MSVSQPQASRSSERQPQPERAPQSPQPTRIVPALQDQDMQHHGDDGDVQQEGMMIETLEAKIQHLDEIIERMVGIPTKDTIVKF